MNTTERKFAMVQSPTQPTVISVVQQRAQLQTAESLLTFKEAMAYLRVSRSTLYRLMWSGKLTGHKVGSTWRFYASELRAAIEDAAPSVPTTRKTTKEAVLLEMRQHL